MNNNRNKGFTLVEVLVAMFILGLGIVSLFGLFPLAWQSLFYSRKLTQVTYFAHKKIDELKAQGKNIQMGENSGKDGDLSWAVTREPLKLVGGVEVVYVQLDIKFDFQSREQKQRFITYLSGD